MIMSKYIYVLFPVSELSASLYPGATGSSMKVALPFAITLIISYMYNTPRKDVVDL